MQSSKQKILSTANDHPIDVLELEANGYVVVAQDYLEKLETIRAVAMAAVDGDASVEELAVCLGG
jgi:hypothetical protein